MSRYIYAAKININQNIFYSNFDSLIPLIGEAILNYKDKIYETKTLKWTFVDVKKIQLDSEEYITGKLCKVRKKVVERRYDDDMHDTYWEDETNKAYENIFLYDEKSEIIVFEDTYEIDKKTFIEKFERLCYLINPTIGEIKIKLYPKSADIDKILAEINKIYYAKFNIIPANYTSKNGFKKLDEALKEEKISEINVTLKNKEGEISKEEDTVFSQCVNMVKNAYGTFVINVKNVNEKVIKRIDSECTIYKKNIKIDSSIQIYIKKFKELIDIIKRENHLN